MGIAELTELVGTTLDGGLSSLDDVIGVDWDNDGHSGWLIMALRDGENTAHYKLSIYRLPDIEAEQ